MWAWVLSGPCHLGHMVLSRVVGVGGNIIINTSTSPDLPPTHIEAATMGYRFLPPSNLLHRNFPTYPQQETSPRDGKEKTIKSQKFLASRRQAWAIGDKEKTVTTSPLAQVSAPSPNQDQGRLDINVDSLGGQGRPDTNADRAGAQALTHKETDVTPHDNNLFYKNGNPRTNLTARPLPCGRTSKARKRQGGRKRNRRRNRRDRPSDEASVELNPTTTERSQQADDPTQTGSDAIPLFPHQYIGMVPKTPLVELETENGAACFGPNTALLIQDPLNWTTHAPVETLTRPIGSLKYGDTVLAD